MNERLKELRKTLNLTQQKFADNLHISRNNIATYETGKSEPGNAVILLICKEFNVNEEWLRYGNGSMFKEIDTFNLDEFAKSRGATEEELSIMKSYFELDKETRLAILDFFTGRLKKENKFNAVPKTPEELERKYKPIEETENNVG